MREDNYQLALRCKKKLMKGWEQIGTLIPYRDILYTDYTVEGTIDEYQETIEKLRLAIVNKYPSIGVELKLHNDEI